MSREQPPSNAQVIGWLLVFCGFLLWVLFQLLYLIVQHWEIIFGGGLLLLMLLVWFLGPYLLWFWLGMRR